MTWLRKAWKVFWCRHWYWKQYQDYEREVFEGLHVTMRLECHYCKKEIVIGYMKETPTGRKP